MEAKQQGVLLNMIPNLKINELKNVTQKTVN